MVSVTELSRAEKKPPCYEKPRMARVLVVEDEADLREVLEYNLTQAGHRVRSAPSGAEALRIAQEHKPELVLLDLMLPDVSGTEVCRSIRKDPQLREARIIMVTAKAEEIDRVVGFELGADDYVAKPFSVRELLLRVQAVLRRAQTADTPVLELGGIRVDRVAHRVTVNGQEIQLTSLEFKLLVTLLERKNRVQTRGTLLTDVWGFVADIESRTVDTHVKRLREKLGSAGQCIETVRGVGYRLVDSSAA
jgi:two-component system phosphate regulon response regulator PhoB